MVALRFLDLLLLFVLRRVMASWLNAWLDEKDTGLRVDSSFHGALAQLRTYTGTAVKSD
jgi:hypothetical protein